MEKLYVDEVDGAKWFVSYGKPYFQGGQAIEVDENTARALIKAMSSENSDKPRDIPGMEGTIGKMEDSLEFRSS